MTTDAIYELIRSSIDPNPDNPRQTFDQADLDSLATSMQEVGLQNPILVRPNPDTDSETPRYILIDGERRLRAAQQLGWLTIPAIVRTPLTRAAQHPELELAAMLATSLQRAGLNPIEEADALATMRDRHDLAQHALAKLAARSEGWVSKRLAIGSLPERMRTAIAAGDVGVNTGYAIAQLTKPQREQVLARIGDSTQYDDGALAKALGAWQDETARDEALATEAAIWSKRGITPIETDDVSWDKYRFATAGEQATAVMLSARRDARGAWNVTATELVPAGQPLPEQPDEPDADADARSARKAEIGQVNTRRRDHLRELILTELPLAVVSIATAAALGQCATDLQIDLWAHADGPAAEILRTDDISDFVGDMVGGFTALDPERFSAALVLGGLDEALADDLRAGYLPDTGQADPTAWYLHWMSERGLELHEIEIAWLQHATGGLEPDDTASAPEEAIA